MAKVTGPLFSLAAQGTVGKSIVFSMWNGLCRVRKWLKTPDPKSADQLTTRSRFISATIGMYFANHTAEKDGADPDLDKVQIIAVPPPQQVPWNSYLIQKVIGPANANMADAETAWDVLDGTDQDAWDTAALALTPPFEVGGRAHDYDSDHEEGLNFWYYRWGLYEIGIDDEPAAVPPTYA